MPLTPPSRESLQQAGINPTHYRIAAFLILTGNLYFFQDWTEWWQLLFSLPHFFIALLMAWLILHIE